MTQPVEIRVRMSGVFDSYFAGTPVARGKPDHDDPPLLATTYADATRVKTGAGYYQLLKFRGTSEQIAQALRALISHAETRLDAAPDRRQRDSAAQMLNRCAIALRRLDQIEAVRQHPTL